MTVSRPASPPLSGPPPALLLPSPIHHSLLPRGAGQCTGRHNSTYFGQVLIIAPCSLLPAPCSCTPRSTSWPDPRLAPARPPPSSCPSSTGSSRPGPTPAAAAPASPHRPSSSPPPQPLDETRKFAHSSGAKAGILYGGTSTGDQADKLRSVSSSP